MKIVGILLELLVIGVNKEEKKGEEDKAIKKEQNPTYK